MTEHVHISIENQIGCITLDRPKALNSLSLQMIRTLTEALLAWRDNAGISAVLMRSSSEKAFCAGGDIRFFYEVGTATPREGSALLEDFFTEEYALNHLIHHYPKPYIALMDGVVMGGGMGIAQAGPDARVRIVTERTKMAMPEVNIGLFPDVGGGYFLSHCPGQIGAYLGVTGETITAADALYAGLADTFVPSAQLPLLIERLHAAPAQEVRSTVQKFAAGFIPTAPEAGMLEANRAAIERHFASDTIAAITASLAQDDSPFAQKTLATMQKRSPLMMCVTLEQIRRSAALNSVADCLRMERTMVRHCFEHGEVIEGVRALVVDKDNAPQWNPPTLAEVTPDMIAGFFTPVWPPHAHPLKDLEL